MVWSDGREQLLIYLRRDAVEQLAATEPGRPSTVVFDPLVDLADSGIRDWMRLVSSPSKNSTPAVAFSTPTWSPTTTNRP